MKTLRKLTLALCKTILVFSLFAFVMSVLALRVLGNHDQTKRWLRESNIYSVATKSLRKNLVQNVDTTGQASNPIIQSAVDKSITEEVIQNFAEDSLGQTYSWLEGETKEPELAFDTTKIQEDFANNVATGLTERSANLPICPGRTLPNTQDIFAINCLPRGYDIAPEIEKARQQILATDTQDLQKTATIDANGAAAESPSQQSLLEPLKPIKNYYHIISILPIISAVVFVILAGIMVALSKPRYRALRTLATLTIPYGIMYVIGGWLLPHLTQNSLNTLIDQLKIDEFGAPVKLILQSMVEATSSYLVIIGVGLIVIGNVLLGAYMFTKKKLAPQNTKPTDQPLVKT